MQKVEVMQRVVKPAVPAVTEDCIVLRLTREEAEFLLALTGCTKLKYMPEAFGAPRSGTWDTLYRALGLPRTSFGRGRYTVERLGRTV